MRKNGAVMKHMLLAIFLSASCLSSAASGWKDYYKKLKKNLKSKNDMIIFQGIKGCSGHDGKEATTFLIKFANSSKNKLYHRVTAISVIKNFKSDETKETIKAHIKGKTDFSPLMLDMLMEMELASKELLTKILYKTRNQEILAMIIKEMAKEKEHPKKMIDVIMRHLKNARSSQGLVKACLEAMASIKSTAATKIMIDKLDDRVFKETAAVSLTRLTGKELGESKEAWEKWHKENPKFDPVNQSLEDYQAKETKKKEDAEKEGSSFYGIPITGKNVLFILDRSGSMRTKAKSDTRLDELKRELERMVESLPGDISFGLVWFPHEQYPTKGISKASDKFKEKVIKYIKGINAAGSTPISEAMTFAFEKVLDKKNIDTIYLLSDGAPNNPEEGVRKLIKQLNQGKYVTIHTISFGRVSKFLKDVASDNNGQYAEVK